MRKTLVLAAVCSVLLIGAGPAKADRTSRDDPKMIPQAGSAGGCGSTLITLAPFTFSADASGDSTSSGECFLNGTGGTISSIQVTTVAPPSTPGGPCDSDDYSFAGSPFFSKVGCSYNFSSGLLTVTFFGIGGNFPGIPAKTDFYMDLDGWNANELFTGAANPGVPEPDSILLVAFGLAALVVVRRGKFTPRTV